MTISLTICVLSLFALATLVWNKNSELSKGAPMFRIGNESTDETLLNLWNIFVYTVTHVSISSMRNLLHSAVIAFERLFINQFENVTRRFAVFGDIVTGRDIPKNRGSVSFFLKNIESREGAINAKKTGTIEDKMVR